ncbi:Rieske (2Fe-2S) protein [Alicyclobacillus ferrooxydans]|uniref:(2Fe-2S)-binding protein n=1 Tax=Alicyclobacillus ferrooxydans TaxID=471514 RepID=A0A0P9ETD4_9BACL|nr:Rieske (2Fe-2S) protein [Alicyclobacillus ferrooxydans]KPV42056.1 (2Fe-2S)-binding protein [Alicyclobacillus ferrooxydans]
MANWILAGTASELEQSGAKVITGAIVVFAHEGQFYAVENRCPHMGFPLHMGSVCDGILTCHWHHARFDVCSGGTLDPWADDVPAHDVKVEDGQVYVFDEPKVRKGIERHKHRLREGLQQNLSLIIAKSVVALMEAKVPPTEIAAVGIDFGTRQRSAGWGSGLTILSAMVNVLPKLDTYGQILALVHGLTHVARDCAGRAPKYALDPLPPSEFSTKRLAAWYRECIEVRDTDGAERVLLAACERGADSRTLADMMLLAATDHVYLDGGHTFDFHNKAFEMTDAMKGEISAQILTSLVPLLGNPTRSEELQNWRAPIDLIEPMQRAFSVLDSHPLATDGSLPDGFDEAEFVELLLSDNPNLSVEQLTSALLDGADPVRLAQLVVLAAAERIVRFHTQNDFGDWIAVLHTFTHAHAVQVRLQKRAHPLVIRALYHTVTRIYLDRFLNVPAAKRPNAKSVRDAGTRQTAEFLTLLDQRQQVNEAAAWVSEYLETGGDRRELLNTLGHALLREDAEFHSFQMYEAAVQEFDAWDASASSVASYAKETLLIALARYLAAHAPTARELPQIVRIAWRLSRNEKLYEAD